MEEIPNLDADITRKDLEGMYIEQSLVGGPGRTLFMRIDAFGEYAYKVYFFGSVAFETPDLDAAIKCYNTERPAPPEWWATMFETVDKMEALSDQIDTSAITKARNKPGEN